jgi:uncharacterized protein involved in exopolysaccharide biosynthesis
MESQTNNKYQEYQKYQEYEEIDLREMVLFLAKKKWFILAVAVFFILGAVIYSAVAPKVYKIENALEVGLMIGPGGAQAIESPVQLKGKLDNDIYGQKVRESLKISQSKYPKIKTENLKDSDIISLKIESSLTDQNKKVLEGINSLVIGDHEKILSVFKRELQDSIAVEKKSIERIQNKIKSLESEQQTLGDKIAALQKVLLSSYDPGIQFIILDTKQQLENKKQEIENLYLAINASQDTINSLEYDIEKSRSTFAIKQPSVSEQPVGPRILLNSVIAGMLGLMVGVFLAFFLEWTKKKP